MSLVTGNLLIDLIGIAVAIFATVYAYFQWTYQIWKKKGIPYFEPRFPFGNIQKVHKITISDDVKNVVEKAKKKGWKYFGMFFGVRPIFVIMDLDAIKTIFIKDFNYFTERGEYINERDDPLSANLFTLGGDKWKALRTKLTPNFTSGKIKGMFQNFLECSSALDNYIRENCNESIDVHHVLACFTVDIIGSFVMGVQCNSLVDSEASFLKYCRKFVTRNKFDEFWNTILVSFPNLSRALHMKLLPTDITKLFYDVVTKNIKQRKKNNINRKDLLQMLMGMLKSEEHIIEKQDAEDKTLTLDEVVAQCFVFFLGGFETSSVTMTFSLYELSLHPEIQEKVREEVFRVYDKYDNKLEYDSLKDFIYMQQVIDEILRKYPPLPFVFRQCVEDYKIPNLDVVLEKDMTVLIPIKNLHYDEDVFENPEEFKPERFTPENKNELHSFAYIPFGEGPRICPGMRFGLTQAKLGLATILKNFRIKLDPRMKTPIELDPKSFVTSPKDGMWLCFEKLS